MSHNFCGTSDIVYIQTAANRHHTREGHQSTYTNIHTFYIRIHDYVYVLNISMLRLRLGLVLILFAELAIWMQYKCHLVEKTLYSAL